MVDRLQLLKMVDIKKEFSGVYALSGISFDLKAGEVHCLIGENGAGKSTLMKILSGAYSPTEGYILIGNQKYDTLNPQLSKKMGINTVYQENDLVPNMNVVENIYVGNEIDKYGFIDYKLMLENAVKQINELKIDIDPLQKIEDMSVSDQQYVKILKALSTNPKILIMDEPTSMFNEKDKRNVLDLVGRIVKKGIGVIYISHYLDEIKAVSDRITVIRDGAVINTYDNRDRNIDLNIITGDMVGRSLDQFYKKQQCDIGDIFLEVKNLRIRKNDVPVSFYVRKGEILGFAGMVGSGRTEIIRALTGADRKYSCEVYLGGKKVVINSPHDSIKYGFAHITEDRQKLGLSLGSSIIENITIVGLDKIKGFFININKHINLIKGVVEDLNIKSDSMYKEVKFLSGGNQQKVVLAKWIFADKEIYIFDEPTRGIDINAKHEFYKIMSSLSQQGKIIIMISSDMPELISMSDRILVIRDGCISAELQGDEINEHNILKKALGVLDYEK